MFYKFLVVIVFVFIKAMFSAADTAITYVNKYKIFQLSKKDIRAKRIKYFIEEKNRFYGIIEVVITLIELLATAYASEKFVNDLAEKIVLLDVSAEMAIFLSIVIVAVVLSYVLLVFGAILPKQIARNYPEKTIYILINIICFVSILSAPFNWIIKTSTKIFAKIFRIQPNPKDKLTEKEIKMMIAEGADQGVIAKIEKQIATKALNFEDIKIKDIMIKKEDIDFINISDSKKKILENIEDNHYTRFPVYKDNQDNIIGIFNIKDIIIQYAKTKEMDIDVEKYLRDIMFIEKDEPVSKAFRNMQNKKISMAIIINEEQKVVGMVTLENLLETLVGKIFDEFEKDED